MINDHFSHVHATFWLGIKQRSNRRRSRRNLHGTRRIRSQICMTHVYQKPAPCRKIRVDLWRRFLGRVPWVLETIRQQVLRLQGCRLLIRV